MLDDLKEALETLLAMTGGALVGAGAGAAIGAAVGSVVPAIGTAIGAIVGAIVGAIIGLFAGLAVEKAIEEKLLDAQGISDKSYCKIMSGALSGLELNVPIYHYNIKSAKDNIENEIDDPILQTYYQQNYSKCRYQNTQVSVPAGIASLFAPEAFGDTYH